MSEFIPFPQKEYSIIYADPPWRYSDRGCNGNAADHYADMSFSDMCRLPVNGHGGGITCCKRLCFVHVGHIPHDAGSVVFDRRMGIYLQKYSVSMGKAKPQRQRLLFWPRPVDTGKYGAVSAGNQGQAPARVKRREPTGGIPHPAAFTKAPGGTGSHRDVAGGCAAHRAVCPRSRARLGLLGQRSAKDRGLAVC